jgi:hypothetical protein
VETITTAAPKESQRQQLQLASPNSNSRVKRATGVAARASWAATSTWTLAIAEMFAAKEHTTAESKVTLLVRRPQMLSFFTLNLKVRKSIR